jgi:predicted O-methyltransferase YrrM
MNGYPASWPSIAERFTDGYCLGMAQELWTAVDRYLADNLIPSDPVLTGVLEANASAGLPAFDVAPNQGKLIHLLARMCGAKRILEIGTLGGYSTIWLARALPPDGTLVTLEFEKKHAEVAAANLKRAGLASVVEVRIGPAVESLAQLHKERAAPFDLIFIDADKANNPAYLEWSLRLSRPGTVIVCDNVIRDGAIIDAGNAEPAIRGIRSFFAMVANEPRLDATALQTVGSKGYDGFALAIVKS